MPHTDSSPHWALQWGARFVLFALLTYSMHVLGSSTEQAKLLELAYDIVRSSLYATGGTIPEGDIPVFTFTILIAGWSVSVDANLWLFLVLPFLPKRFWLPVIILITLTHAFAGYLGFAFMVLGLMTATSIWLILAPTAWLGLRFIGDGLRGDEEDNPNDMAKKVMAGLISIVAFGLYWAVSYDEFFMVIQRFWWMVTQGWDYLAQATLIGLSMAALLPFLLIAPLIYLAFPGLANWIEERGDKVMYLVFSLIMYYLVRGIAQNGLSYLPGEIPYTGMAPDLLAAGLVLTWLYKQGFKNATFEAVATKVLLLDVEIMESIRQMRIVKADEAEDDGDEEPSSAAT